MDQEILKFIKKSRKGHENVVDINMKAHCLPPTPEGPVLGIFFCDVILSNFNITATSPRGRWVNLYFLLAFRCKTCQTQSFSMAATEESPSEKSKIKEDLPMDVPGSSQDNLPGHSQDNLPGHSQDSPPESSKDNLPGSSEEEDMPGGSQDYSNRSRVKDEDDDDDSAGDEASSEGTMDYSTSDLEETDNRPSHLSTTAADESNDDSAPPSVSTLLKSSKDMDQATCAYLAKTLAHVEETVAKKNVPSDTDSQAKEEVSSESEQSNTSSGFSVPNLDVASKAYLAAMLNNVVAHVDSDNKNNESMAPIEPDAEFDPHCTTTSGNMEETPYYTCHICGLNLRFMSAMKNHMRTHSNERPYDCKQCGKTFRHPHNLQSHVQDVHEAEKPYECSLCGEKFRLPTKFKMHMKNHDPDYQKGWKWPCDICGKKFRGHGNLKIHKLMHQGIKPFKCTECDYECYSESYLKVHNRVHTGEKPYQCRVCERRFKQCSQWRTHERLHLGRKEYPCKQCGKKYAKAVVVTVLCRYNVINFHPNPLKRHLIPRPWGRGMGCLLWVQPLIKFYPYCRSAVYNIIMIMFY